MNNLKTITAITLWQPWASLVAAGMKAWETRSWPTDYRGPLLIHSAARKSLPYRACFGLEAAEFVQSRLGPWQALPRGQLLVLCHLADCLPVEQVLQRDPLAETSELAPYEFEFGDYSPGRWAWRVRLTNRLHPYQVTGRQGLWKFQVPGPGWLDQVTAERMPRPSHPSSLPY
ncbi:MAG: ASCH domain-containing protein [Lentisphaeria bacterium]